MTYWGKYNIYKILNRFWSLSCCPEVCGYPSSLPESSICLSLICDIPFNICRVQLPQVWAAHRNAASYPHHFKCLAIIDRTWDSGWHCPSTELNLAVTGLYLEKYFPGDTVTDHCEHLKAGPVGPILAAERAVDMPRSFRKVNRERWEGKKGGGEWKRNGGWFAMRMKVLLPGWKMGCLSQLFVSGLR